MTIEVNVRKILDRKQWEMCNFSPVNSAAGSFIVSSNLGDQLQFYIVSATVAYIYDPNEDGWILLPSPALAGTFGAGACGARHPHGPRGFPTAGTTTTMTTGLNLQRILKGYKVRFIAGPNAGTEATIKTNTLGANSVVTFDSTLGSTITTASEFIMITGRIWVVNAGTLAAGSFKYYDLATNTWNNGTQTGLPATIATDARLVSTPGGWTNFLAGTSTGSNTTTTLNHTGKTWVTNTWTNYQVRITSGTGAGQFRTIASNTATALTVSVAWTTTPDATSQYVIEGNDDYLYFLGNNAVTMYRYSISGSTWTTLAPSVARAAAPVAGMSASWVGEVVDTTWNDASSTTQPAGFLNGQYIYSFRGTTAILDRYNICTNAWDNDVAYAPKADTFPTGTSWCYAEDNIYAMLPGGRLVQYNVPENHLDACSQLWYTQGVTVIGDRMFDVTFTEGTTTLRWLYYVTATQPTLFRMMII